ncbi:17534_t:CDS:2, partial [Cetraspora pellucida]
THNELVSLNSEFNYLLKTYKPQDNFETNDSDNNSESENNLSNLSNISNKDDLIFDTNSILSQTQINIYHEKTYRYRLSTIQCCTISNCLITKVNHNHGLIKYRQIQNYSKTELDIFLLAIMEASTRVPEQTTIGNPKTLQTILYKFEEIKICRKAFLIIYGI